MIKKSRWKKDQQTVSPGSPLKKAASQNVEEGQKLEEAELEEDDPTYQTHEMDVKERLQSPVQSNKTYGEKDDESRILCDVHLNLTADHIKVSKTFFKNKNVLKTKNVFNLFRLSGSGEESPR